MASEIKLTLGTVHNVHSVRQITDDQFTSWHDSNGLMDRLRVLGERLHKTGFTSNEDVPVKEMLKLWGKDTFPLRLFMEWIEQQEEVQQLLEEPF